MNTRGHLVPLKTLYELESKERLSKAYVVEIPVKLASKALNIIKPVLPIGSEDSSSYYFLRRLVTTPRLPTGLREDVQVQDSLPTIHFLIPPPLPLVPDDIVSALRPHVESEHLPIVRTTPIPVDPPSTAEQAALWSEKYWPCTFNPASQTIQKAPPLGILRSTKSELEFGTNLESYFGLAKLAATECRARALGREIAAVVVDSVKEEAIAVAGDARWYRQSSNLIGNDLNLEGFAEGRPEHHPLMRAIAMVAGKTARSRNDDDSLASNEADVQDANLGGRALTPVERFYTVVTNRDKPPANSSPLPTLPSPQSTERTDAYLCSGLDVYLTHEPCVACSMAMIHSRFRACVFLNRMPSSGGLCAEKDANGCGGGLRYGLFWRKELNWRVLAFQYFPVDDEINVVKDEHLTSRAGQSVDQAFHA